MPSLTTFLSYAHEDRRQRKNLRSHCGPLKRSGIIELWDDCELQVGEKVDSMIQAVLARTDVFILLVSPEFLSSEYCWSVEMKHALERHRAGTALILPIITKHCGWRDSPLGELVVAPTDGKPISSWSPRDAGWADATRRMTQSILSFREKRFGPEITPPAPANLLPEYGPRGWRRVLGTLREMLEHNAAAASAPAPLKSAPPGADAGPRPPPRPPPAELTEPGLDLQMVNEAAASASPRRPPAEPTGLFEISLPRPRPGTKGRALAGPPPIVRKPTAHEQVHRPAPQAGASDAPSAPTVYLDASILLPPSTSVEVTLPGAPPNLAAPQPEITEPDALIPIPSRVVEVTKPDRRVSAPQGPPLGDAA